MAKKEFDSSKIKILVCCHKACELPKDDIFLPIQVGAAISNLDLGMQRDDREEGKTCDNISEKNKNYCELTAIYWAWKNISKLYPNLEYIGLNHYRRYFDLTKSPLCQLYYQKINFLHKYTLDKVKLVKILKNNKIIIPSPIHLPYRVIDNWMLNHYEKDLRVIEDLIRTKYADYYESFVDVFYNKNIFSPYNMFLMPIADFKNYAEWIFSILFDAERLIDISNYSDQQARLWGYLAERLMNVYLRRWHKECKKVTTLLFTESNEKNKSYFVFFVRNVIYKLYYILLKFKSKK